MTTLSLIVPAFNCSKTLQAAVESIYRQNSVIPLDVTIVDDGSTDRTYEVMQHLAARQNNIKLVRHSSNRGGGAARNTAVANSAGDLIFCLDSDDMLGPGFLENLTRFWLQKRCDGVGISTSVKFRKSNIEDVEHVHEFEGPGRRVAFESLFDGTLCSLMSTFLMTRDAFHRAGGYPTAHGFDTQGMAFRFLCNGLTAFTCPNTTYYHRVSFHESYYIREDRAGRARWNWLQILLEFLYLFRSEAKARILDDDVFAVQPGPSLVAQLQELHGTRRLYARNYRRLVARGRDGVAQDLAGSSASYDQYWLGEYWLSKNEHAKALDCYTSALKSGFCHWLVYERVVEVALGASGSSTPVAMLLHGGRFFPDGSGPKAESAAPRPSGYQRFENWLFRRRETTGLGEVLKKTRIGIRQLGRARTGTTAQSRPSSENSRRPDSDQ